MHTFQNLKYSCPGNTNLRQVLYLLLCQYYCTNLPIIAANVLHIQAFIWTPTLQAIISTSAVNCCMPNVMSQLELWRLHSPSNTTCCCLSSPDLLWNFSVMFSLPSPSPLQTVMVIRFNPGRRPWPLQTNHSPFTLSSFKTVKSFLKVYSGLCHAITFSVSSSV